MYKSTLPDISCELLPVLHKHLRVARLRWIVLMLLRDVEGHGELRLAGGADSRVHAARHRSRHIHAHLLRESIIHF